MTFTFTTTILLLFVYSCYCSARDNNAAVFAGVARALLATAPTSYIMSLAYERTLQALSERSKEIKLRAAKVECITTASNANPSCGKRISNEFLYGVPVYSVQLAVFSHPTLFGVCRHMATVLG